jgi:tyrosyl-tRNA synthetase
LPAIRPNFSKAYASLLPRASPTHAALGSLDELHHVSDAHRIDVLLAQTAVTTLFVKAGLAGSNGEVRRAIANNAISVNDKRVSDPTHRLSPADVTADGVVKLSFGRKKHVLARAS